MLTLDRMNRAASPKDTKMRTSQNWDMLRAKILVIDDTEANLHLAKQVLNMAGYTDVRTMQDPRLAVDAITINGPDLVLLDLHMPYLDGYEVLEKVQRKSDPDAFLPILVCSSDTSSEARERALKLGANDFILKPYDKTEMLLRVRNFIRMRFMHQALYDENALLEARVQRRTQELMQARAEALDCLARALEYRDDATGGHTKRVGDMSARIAEAMHLDEYDVEMIRIAAPLHDLGKIGISDQLLLKEGVYTDEERAVMQKHTLLGETIIGNCMSPVLQEVKEIALHHHEKWDGTGYPHGLRGTQIPIACRIVALADIYDALTHTRPYKTAWSKEDAIKEIRRLRGTHFDPEVVDAFLGIYG